MKYKRCFYKVLNGLEALKKANQTKNALPSNQPHTPQLQPFWRKLKEGNALQHLSSTFPYFCAILNCCFTNFLSRVSYKTSELRSPKHDPIKCAALLCRNTWMKQTIQEIFSFKCLCINLKDQPTHSYNISIVSIFIFPICNLGDRLTLGWIWLPDTTDSLKRNCNKIIYYNFFHNSNSIKESSRAAKIWVHSSYNKIRKLVE